MSSWIYQFGLVGRGFTSKVSSRLAVCLTAVCPLGGRDFHWLLVQCAATKGNKRRKDGWKDKRRQNKKSLAKAALIIGNLGALRAIATQAEGDRGGRRGRGEIRAKGCSSRLSGRFSDGWAGASRVIGSKRWEAPTPPTSKKWHEKKEIKKVKDLKESGDFFYVATKQTNAPLEVDTFILEMFLLLNVYFWTPVLWSSCLVTFPNGHYSDGQTGLE